MTRALLMGLLMALTSCGTPPSGDPYPPAQSQTMSAMESLPAAPRQAMPPICIDAQQNRFAAETMIGQSRDRDVGGVGFTGHTAAERELAKRFNAEIMSINGMVGSIRGAAEDAMDAQGLPREMMTRGASAMEPWILPNRHLQVDEIDEACTMFEGYRSERSKKRADAQMKILCAMIEEPARKGTYECLGPAFK